jgi:methylenetetrahydrofolate reductase (NADPH)
LVEAVNTLENLGARAILALRGDVPVGRPEVAELTELHSAIELMELIKSCSELELGVAAFPERHPDSPNIEHDIEVLLKKQAAGAKFAITQLFFFASDYISFVTKAKQAGVTMPLIPGILPISSVGQIERMTKLSHAKKPTELIEAMDRLSPDQATELGFEYTVNLSRELLKSGVPGLHIFCLNQSADPLRLVHALQLR